MHIVERDGRLRSVVGPVDELTAVDLLAVVVLWSRATVRSWVGWLTTGQRALRFSSAELEDRAFRRWLFDLPGWKPQRLTAALLLPGVHHVWQRGFTTPTGVR